MIPSNKFWSGRKVFVAGGTGLIGHALIRALVPLGAKVKATEHTRRIDSAWRDHVTVEENCNLLSPWPELYKDQEIVFWAAAKVGGAKAIKERPMELLQYNLELASKNIDWAVRAGVERFCYVSSSYVYPESDRPAVESDTNSTDVPLVHYGLGWIKRFMEKLCKSYQLTSSTRFALVRPTAIYGPFDNFDLESCHVIPALIRKYAELPKTEYKLLRVWGEGTEQRQFTYVDDLVQGMLLATEWECDADPINIATDEVSSVREVVNRLADINDLIPPGMQDIFPYVPPYKMLDVAWEYDKPRVISKRLVDTTACKTKLSYECKTSLKDGLAKTMEWYKSQ